jgi:hypothetical protein
MEDHMKRFTVPTKFAVTLLVVFILLFALTAPVFASSPGQTPTGDPDPLSPLLAQLAGLGGVAALIALLINVGKTIGFVKPDTAPTWSAGANLVVLILLLVAGVVAPNLGIKGVDAQVGEFAKVGVVIVGYVLQLLASKATHYAVKGIPAVGKSYSTDQPQ